MNDEKLAYMANQIGRFFETQRQETAVDAIYDHLVKFWDPRMRKAIVVAQHSGGKIALDPLVREAVARLSHSSQPPE